MNSSCSLERSDWTVPDYNPPRNIDQNLTHLSIIVWIHLFSDGWVNWCSCDNVWRHYPAITPSHCPDTGSAHRDVLHLLPVDHIDQWEAPCSEKVWTHLDWAWNHTNSWVLFVSVGGVWISYEVKHQRAGGEAADVGRGCFHTALSSHHKPADTFTWRIDFRCRVNSKRRVWGHGVDACVHVPSQGCRPGGCDGLWPPLCFSAHVPSNDFHPSDWKLEWNGLTSTQKLVGEEPDWWSRLMWELQSGEEFKEFGCAAVWRLLMDRGDAVRFVKDRRRRRNVSFQISPEEETRGFIFFWS